MIDWKTVLIGSILAIILTFILSIIPFGGTFGYLAAAIYVGYTVGGEYMNGGKHGAIVGFITGIIMVTIILIIPRMNNIGVLLGDYLNLFLFTLTIVFFGIIGAIGGFIGIFIKRRESLSESTT